MSRFWKQLPCLLVLSALLGLASSGRAQAEKAPEPDKTQADVLKQLLKMQESMDDLKRRIDALPDTVTIDTTIRLALVKALKETQEEMGLLKKQVDQLQKDVNSLKSGPTTVKTFSLPTTGKIRLVNTYPGLRAIMVNGKTYRLQAGESQLLEEPIGKFTYEVFGFHTEPQTRELDASREFTVTVYPIYR